MDTADALLRILNELGKIGPTVSLAAARTFATVAANEGLSVLEYAKLLDEPVTTTSTQLLDLSDTARKGRTQPLGLLQRRQDPNNLRQFRYTLSPLGKALLFRIGRVLGA